MRLRLNIAMIAGLIAISGATPAVFADSLIEQQRSRFRVLYPDAELGIWNMSDADEQLLRSYVLWPDLRAAYLRARLGHIDDAEIRSYLDHFGTLKPARELRYRYALHLAGQNRLADYMTIYRQYYQGLEVPKLDCLALQGEITEGNARRVANLGSGLWLIGQSQVDECDPVFDYLRSNQVLNADLYRQRFDLAVDSRKFSLARYLARSIDAQSQTEASLWLEADADHHRFVQNHSRYGDSSGHRQRLIYAIERQALRQPDAALKQWRQIEANYAFSEAQRNDLSRHLALWSARRQLPDAATLLHDLSGDAVDAEVLRWRVRTALREQNWNSVVANVGVMAEDRDAEEWQYWLGIALQRSGEAPEGAAILQRLAGSRSYYGFLAADELGIDYAFSHRPLAADDALVDELRNRASLIRARELFLVGLDGRGRSEWDAAIAYLNQDEMTQAAILAHRWGWHSRAIATAARIGSFDDLDIRYPLPYHETFERHTKASQVRKSWAYGIARSESLFMRDVRSQAGAIGLMQLLPETGRKTAREFNQPFSGLVTLTDPDANIQLGTAYLAKMYQRFNNNQVLATAAYNAGPLNVEAWLPESSQLDARIWIENIPYNETRAYVRRVLTTDTIFHWRLTGTVRRISSELGEITPTSGSPKVARTN